MKECRDCKEFKEFNEFYYSPQNKGNLSTRCKSCSKILSREYRENNKEKRKISTKKWRENNPDYHENWKLNNPDYFKEYLKDWNNENPNYYKIYRRERFIIDPLFKLRIEIGVKTKCALKAKYWIKENNYWFLGCSCNELKEHFEKQFKMVP